MGSYLGKPSRESGHPNRTVLIDSASNPMAGVKITSLTYFA